MRAHLKVGVTTTSTLDGWEIEEYLGPIVAHTVAGTSLFSDFFAGLSDVFGGRSGSYQNQLRSLSDEAIGAVRAKAYDRRANWVVGLTVDMDEISGQNKQMFMVTAMGTAVRAVRRHAPHTNSGPIPARIESTDRRTSWTGNVGTPSGAPTVAGGGEGRLALDAVLAASRRYAVLEALQTGKLAFDDSTWSTLAEDRIAEAAPAVLRTLGRLNAEARAGDVVSHFRQRTAAFLDRLGETHATRALYEALTWTASDAEAAIPLIKELKLRDLAAILLGLEHPEPEMRRRALQTLLFEQRTYGVEDVEYLEAIATACTNEATFPRFAVLQPGSGKGFFGGKDRLRCSCGTERAASEANCTNRECWRDSLGFRPGEVTPEVAVAHCRRGAVTLRRMFVELGELVETPPNATDRLATTH